MVAARASRRERLRAAMLVEAKDAARRQLVAGGPGAISLRAIARDVGISASALYAYYPSLDALVADLVTDLFGELGEVIERARDTVASDDQLGRLASMARMLRQWAIAHPQESVLVFGNPDSEFGFSISDDVEPTLSATLRFGTIFLDVFIALWKRGEPPFVPSRRLHPGFAASLASPLATMTAGLPAEVAYLLMSGWTQIFGLISMEVHGQLQWAVTDPEPLFETALADLLSTMVPAGDASPAPGGPAEGGKNA
ncbi:MAG: TetR/AcrR family transcriptional regulator [Dactylosporangium sp.]|nr:TetR/AcrR family transcriptional regulator [Dactylosporangium sp.]NNJ60946.1 TetR/AcrR family transcriptional regulator [Dactylosporangium sp.]